MVFRFFYQQVSDVDAAFSGILFFGTKKFVRLFDY